MASPDWRVPLSISSSKGGSYSCLACHDSGVLVNSDGLINHFPEMSEYDHIHGRPARPESHMPVSAGLICTCDAAYEQKAVDKEDGQLKVIRSGFRYNDGRIKTTDSWAGVRHVGAEPPDGLIAFLVNQRAQVLKVHESLTSEERKERIRINLLMLREQITAAGIGDICSQAS